MKGSQGAVNVTNRILDFSLAFVLPLVALAGCMGSTSEPTDQIEDAPSSSPLGALRILAHELPCDLKLGAYAPGPMETTSNVRELALDPLDDLMKVTHGELDAFVHADKSLMAVGRYMYGGGFDLVDVTDPQNPVQITTWIPPDEDFTGDVKFLSNGVYAAVAGSETIRLVDLRDLEEPVLEHTYRLEAPGAHMITVFPVEGRDYIAASKGEGFDISIFKVEGDPGTYTLSRVAHPLLTPTGDAVALEPIHSHDSWFEVDSVLQKPVLWVANVWWGIVALDVSDPSAPQEIARAWNADPNQGYTHTMGVTHLDGKRYVVASQEYGTPAMKVWDFTDLASPKLVATWSHGLPTKPQHNLQVVGRYVYLAHFEDGLYVFDLKQIGNNLPGRIDPIAHAEAVESLEPIPRQPAEPGFAYHGPRDVVLANGVVWTSETSEGLRSLLFGCLTPGDEEATSTG